jgi:hypothetical protein
MRIYTLYSLKKNYAYWALSYSYIKLLIQAVCFMILNNYPLKAQWQLCVPPALTISNSAFGTQMFRIIPTVNRDYFLKQHKYVDLCNGEVLCFLRGKVWIAKYYSAKLRLQLSIMIPVCALWIPTSNV